MNKHVYITEYGSFLGVTSQRLSIHQNKEVVKEFPLSRIKSINVMKKGVTLSSDLIEICAEYGIKIFFLDFKGVAVSAIYGTAGHAVANVRRSQFLTIECSKHIEIAKSIINTKLKNQRATLQYFFKYFKKHHQDVWEFENHLESMKKLIGSFQKIDISIKSNPLNYILGKEGSGANIYFSTIKKYFIKNNNFTNRIGRGADDIVNKSLNYGYAILSSFVWQCVINAGLEPYAGVLHTQRAGKPSLVLDIMEEYRAWVVDRNIIKMRNDLYNAIELDSNIKNRIIRSINDTMHKKYFYHKKKLSLESIMQRQVYKLTGSFVDGKKYKGYIFKW